MGRLDNRFLPQQQPTVAEIRALRTLQKAQELLRDSRPPEPEVSVRQHPGSRPAPTAPYPRSPAEEELLKYMKELATSGMDDEAGHQLSRRYYKG